MISLQPQDSRPAAAADWREPLSALVDGHCTEDELDALLRGEGGRDEQARLWSEYQLVAQALRDAEALPGARDDFVAGVMARLADEPLPVQAEGAGSGASAERFAAAAANDAVWRWRLAAGVATAAALGSLAWQFAQGGSGPELARIEAVEPPAYSAVDAPPQGLQQADGVLRDAGLDAWLASRRQSALVAPTAFGSAR